MTETLETASPRIEEALPETPFVGLVPYSEEDAAFFFGRRREQTIVTANLRAARLTILYGPSGVGKTSLLHAGVVHDLRRLVARNAGAEGGRTPFATAVFANWRDDPLAGLAETIRSAAEEALGGATLEPWQPGEQLVEALGRWTQRVRTILVVLDQFEDYFLYHPDEDGPGTFAVDFPAAVNESNLRVNFLLSIREDALAKLDRFEGRIPNLFGNYLRVDYLDREEAREAIEGPIGEYNRLLGGGPEFSIEPALVEVVVDAAASGRLALAAVGDVPEEPFGDRVETPFLQLVMERLWRSTVDAGSHELTLATLERLGGAQRIVETHLTEALGTLSREEQDVAADLFRFLVTRSKTKIAHGGSDLADWVKRPEAEVESVLERLTRGEHGRILRPIAPPVEGGDTRFEIFHDVLAEPILEWRARNEQERARRAAVRRQSRLRVIAGGLAAIVAGLAALSVWALHERNVAASRTRTARSQALAANARGQLAVDPERSLLLALAAFREADTPDAEDALREALLASRVRVTLRGHHGSVVAASFSPDGRHVLTAGQDGTARIWDARSGRDLVTIPGHAPLLTAAFSPDGRLVATAGRDGAARIWQARNGRLIATLRPPGGASAARFSPDGKSVATAGLAGVQLWRLGAERPFRFMHAPAPQVDVAFSPNGRLLVTAGVDTLARVWRVADGHLMTVLAGTQGPVTAASFSHDGKLVITNGEDRAARVWHVTGGPAITVFSAAETSFVQSAAFAPDGKRVVTAGEDGAVRIWPLAGGVPFTALRGHTGFVNGAEFSADGRRLVTAGADGTARIWDAVTTPPGVFLRGHRGGILATRFSRDGKLLVTASEDGTARIWRVATHSLVRVLRSPMGFLAGVAISPDGKLVATGGLGGGDVFQAATGRLVAPLRGSGIAGLAFSRDGRFLLTGHEDGTARLWRVGSWRVIKEWPVLGLVVGATFSPVGGLFATGGQDGLVQLRQAPSGRLVKVLRGGGQSPLFGIKFSPDGKLLVAAEQDGTAQVWDIATGQVVLILHGHTAWATDASFSPDERQILTSSGDGTVRLWDARTGRMLTVLTGHTGAVFDAVFSPDGKTIASSGQDAVTWLYPLSACETCAPIDKLLALARSRVTRGLTPAERQEFRVPFTKP